MCSPSLWHTLDWQAGCWWGRASEPGWGAPAGPVQVVMGSSTGRRDESHEPIRTRQADGPAQVFWQALLAGDEGSVAEILRDPGNNLSPNAVFDTSDLEEWKNYRFNPRGLSMGEQWGSACGVCCGAWLLLGLCYGCHLGCRGVGMGKRARGCGLALLYSLWKGGPVSESTRCIQETWFLS